MKHATCPSFNTGKNRLVPFPFHSASGEGWGDSDFDRGRILVVPNHPHPSFLPTCRENGPERASAFTLIETMIAVLLMALLAGTVAFGFSHSLNSARTADAVEAIRSFDQMGRQAACQSGGPIRLVFDLSNNTVEQRDGTDLSTMRTRMALPPGTREIAVCVEGVTTSSGEMNIDISAHGWSKSYAVQMTSAGTNRWLIFAGMTGEMSQVSDESQIPKFSTTLRYDTH